MAAGTSWQPTIRDAPVGAVFCVKSGVHRAQTVYPKDRQQFLGESGAVMSGAVVITGATRSGAQWVVAGPKFVPDIRGLCIHDRPACNDPTTLFIDGKPLQPVLDPSEVGEGTFFREKGTDILHFVDDPTGKTVEVTAATFAFVSNHAKGVVVRGLCVEKYGNPAQLGAIYSDFDLEASDWLIENNEVRLNSGAGIVGGPHAVVRHNQVHDNGQLGIHPHGDAVLVEANEIAYNNTRGFDPTWDAGGMKAAVVKDLVVRGNWVHHNHGPGLWCDIECRNVTIERNKVEDNADAGILYEISYDAVIDRNVVRWNGQGGPGSLGHSWFWGAEIQISASEHVDINHNSVFVGGNGSAIMLIDQGREKDGRRDFYRTAHNSVHDNQIWLDGPGTKTGGVSDVPKGDPNYAIIETGGNRFDKDDYYALQREVPCVFAWGHATYDFAAFRRLGQELHGRYSFRSAKPRSGG